MTEPVNSLLLSRIRTIARDWIDSTCPEESALFDLVWNLLLQQRESSASSARDRLSNLGLPFAAEQRIRLISPYAILIVSSVMRELDELGRTPKRESVYSAVVECAKALGAGHLLTGDRAQSLADKVFSAFLHEQRERPVESDPSQELPHDHVNTLWLLRNDREPSSQIMTRADAVMFAKSRDFDLIIDELVDRLTVSGSPVGRLSGLSKRRQRMLWVVVTNVNCRVSYGDVQQAFGIRGRRPVGLAQHMQQHASAFRRLLGNDLAGRVLPKATGGGWRIAVGEWSFCWLLQSLDTTKSQLVSGGSGSPSERT